MTTRKLLPPSDVDGVLGGAAVNEKWKDLYTEKINGASIAEGGAATTSIAGLMSAADKVKLDGVPTPTEGDAGKAVAVNDTEDGYELVDHLSGNEFETVSVTSTDDATSATAAPLKSAGGLAVAKDAIVGGRLTARNGSHRYGVEFFGNIHGWDTGYVRRLYDATMFSPQSGAAWGVNKYLVIPFLSSWYHLQYLRVVVCGQAVSTTVGETLLMDKSFILRGTDVAFNLNQGKVNNNYGLTDADVTVVHTGADYNALIKIKNTIVALPFPNWNVVVEIQQPSLVPTTTILSGAPYFEDV